MAALPNRDREGARRPLRGVLLALLGLVFLAAALGKALRPVEFGMVVRYLLPPSISGDRFVSAGVLLILAWEAFLGACLLAGAGWRGLLGAAGVTLLGFTCVLVLLAADPVSPGCGCLSLLRWSQSVSRDAPAGIVRNIAMLWIVWYLWRTTGRQEQGKPILHAGQTPGGVTPGGRGISPRAFTLIEVLLSIVVISILLSLALPTLATARERGRTIKSLSLERQLAAVIGLYSADYADSFPYFMTPGQPEGPKRLPGLTMGRFPAYFIAGSVYWPNLLRGTYLDEAVAQAAGLPDAGVSNQAAGYPLDTVRSRYLLTHTVFADPNFWHGDQQPDDLSLLRATRQHEVTFPAQKGIFLDILGGLFDPARRRLGNVGTDALVARCDGSAGIIVWNVQDTKRIVGREYGAIAWPVLSTRDGLRGTDF